MEIDTFDVEANISFIFPSPLAYLLTKEVMLVKKKVLLVFSICLLLLGTVIFAATEYEFKIEYEGEVVATVQKDATVTLTGTEATTYPKVRVESEQISGPEGATPTVLAYDEPTQQWIDISKEGNWGPEEGFAVGGTFTNVTKIKITYPVEGTYVSKLSLVDLSNDEAVIASNQFTVVVQPAPKADPEPENNTVDSIPKAGTSIWTYVAIVLVAVLAVWAVIYFVKNKKA